MLKNIKLCGSCAFRSQSGDICALTNTAITNEDYCSKHQESPKVCDICGRFIVGPSVVDGNRILCMDCLKILGTCGACSNSQSCAFNDTQSGPPPTIAQTVRQGNLVLHKHVKNPERIQMFCLNCLCWNNGCMRECGNCANYKEN